MANGKKSGSEVVQKALANDEYRARVERAAEELGCTAEELATVLVTKVGARTIDRLRKDIVTFVDLGQAFPKAQPSRAFRSPIRS